MKYYLEVTDPRTLIYSDNEVLAAKAYVDMHAASQKGQVPSVEFANNKRIVDAAIHPSTGEIIPKLFRVSSIAPVNIPIVLMMLSTPATNVPLTLFGHWVNQSYNTACNYSNRSSASIPLQQTAIAYTCAVTAACSCAYGLGKLASRGPFKKYAVLIPVIATAAANVSNVAFTRSDELMVGAPIKDEDGTVRGMSQTAGIKAVAQTAASRCFLVPISCLLFPAMAMVVYKRASLIPQALRTGKVALLSVETVAIYGCLAAALPAALSVFPPVLEFKPSELEPQFRNLTDKAGNPVVKYYASKGL